MFQQVYDPIGQSLGLTSIFAALPLLTMFVLLGGLKWSPFLSGVCSLVVAIVVAVVAYGMPVPVTLNTAVYGAVFSILPIILIIVNAIWIQNMLVRSGYFEIQRRSFGTLSSDVRVQTVLIAFCFGALLEALAGAGTPIAIVGAMLVGIGMNPLQAAMCALVADTAPVAFGALAAPIVTLAAVTGESFDTLGAMVGRQTPLLGVFIPLVLVWITDGRRGLKQVWPLAVVSGVGFAVAQFICSNYVSVQLSDVVAALVGAGAAVLFLQWWKPSEIVLPDVPVPQSVGAAAVSDLEPKTAPRDSQKDVFISFLPYIAIVVVFVLAQVGFIEKILSVGIFKFAWPGLTILNSAGKPVASMMVLPLLSSTAPLLLFAGILSVPFLGMSARAAAKTYVDTLVQLRWAIPTVLSILAIAFVMNYSGQTITLGRWMAGAGQAFALVSGIIGWLGVAITGSDNSTNALFGALQVAAAKEIGISPVLLAAANSAGGVLGKMISPQSLVIGAAAVGIVGLEGDVFRKCLPWSIGLLLFFCVIVFLQATSVLSWMAL
jgi:lactate permease